jgi:hypothetical protein
MYKRLVEAELELTQEKIKTMEDRVPTCMYGDMQARITQLEQQLTSRTPADWVESRQELEDVQKQLKILREEKKIYQMQIDRAPAFTDDGGNGGSCGHSGYKGGNIL